MASKDGGRKRAATPAQKDGRARSWRRGEARKKAHREANESRHRANVAYLKEHDLAVLSGVLRPSRLVRLAKRAEARDRAV